MDEGLLGQQIPIAIMATGLIQWLKRQPWFPFAKFDAPIINRIFSVCVALATGIGLHFAYDPLIGDGTLTVTGLNWATVLHSGWAAVQQFALQHFVYWTSVKGGQSPATEKEKVAEQKREDAVDAKKEV